VAEDELTMPLRGRAARRRRSRAVLPRLAVGALGVALAVFAGWALVADDPYGGEPMIAVSADPSAPAEPERVATAGGSGGRVYQGPDRAAPAGHSRIVTIIDGSTGQRQEIKIAIPAEAPVKEALLETVRHGSVPRIGPDGMRPAQAYAQVADKAATPDTPRVAIIIAGLGIGSSTTEDAFAQMPAAVTFALTPYASDAAQLAARARAAGHEVLLQVPMEPADYPDNDPGPQTLQVALTPQQNVDHLHWAMSRFQGYVGLINHTGARFTVSEPSLSPILRETARRGLIYVEDGSVPRSVAGQIAGANNLPYARARVIVDAVPSRAGIDRALERLEQIARERGTAVAVSSALPVAIDRIARWIEDAKARGITVVPITAVAARANPN